MSADPKKFIPNEWTVMYLEDMDNFRDQMRSDLKALGFQGMYLEAKNLAQAELVLNNEPVDFFISDWRLPDGTGYDFLNHIRSLPEHEKTPFIMCSSIDDITHIIAAVKSGANDYIIKPWTRAELQKKIEIVLGLKKK